MTKLSRRKYYLSLIVYILAVTLHKWSVKFSTPVEIVCAVVLFAAIANFGIQLFKYYDKHDELVQRNLMKGVCFGAIATGVICLFYSFLNTSVPPFQPEWAFYSLVGFSTLGQQFFIRQTS